MKVLLLNWPRNLRRRWCGFDGSVVYRHLLGMQTGDCRWCQSLLTLDGLLLRKPSVGAGVTAECGQSILTSSVWGVGTISNDGGDPKLGIHGDAQTLSETRHLGSNSWFGNNSKVHVFHTL